MCGTRLPAAVLAPITYSEIEAFARLTGVKLSGWEVELIRDVDDAVRSVSIQMRNPSATIPAKDGKSVAGMLRGIAARKKKDANA